MIVPQQRERTESGILRAVCHYRPGRGRGSVQIAIAVHEGLPVLERNGKATVVLRRHAEMTEKYKMPNPCTSCHSDKANAWAVSELNKWTNFSPWRVGN